MPVAPLPKLPEDLTQITVAWCERHQLQVTVWCPSCKEGRRVNLQPLLPKRAKAAVPTMRFRCQRCGGSGHPSISSPPDRHVWTHPEVRSAPRT